MGLTWTVDSTDISSQVRYRQWALSESAERGVVGASTIIIDDPDRTYTPPGQKAIIVEEAAAGTGRMFTGYIAERTAQRSTMAPEQRQWSVVVEDSNVLIDDRIITDAMGGKRTSTETDHERITWLLGTGAMGSITAGRVPNTNTVTMDKVDYRGKTPRDVLEDCAQKAGKNYFIYRYGSGPHLYYDLSNGDGLTSSVKISDVATEVDNATVFAPSGVSYALDPSRVYSKVRVRYKGGSATATNAATAAAYRTRETYKRYMRVKTADRATEQAQKWLDQADDETRTVSLTITVGAAYVNDIRAGQRVEIKLTRYGWTNYVYWRVTKRTVRQLSDDYYQLELSFAEKVRASRFQDGPDISVDEEASNGSEDTATAVLDENGLTITGGSVTIRNSGGEVILDGSTQVFSIVATGTIVIPASSTRGIVKRSLSVTTGVSYDPASLFFSKVPSRDGTGDWSQPLPELSLSASGTILRSITGRARYDSGAGAAAKTQVQVLRFSSSPPDGATTVRYYILNRTSI